MQDGTEFAEEAKWVLDIDDILEKRRKIVGRYDFLLGDLFEYQQYNVDCTRNYSYYPVLFESKQKLNECMRQLNYKNTNERCFIKIKSLKNC